MRLLVTRPRADAERTAASLRARGHSALIAPLLRIEEMADAEFGEGPWAAIVVTSANAAASIAASERRAQLCALPVFAVGERTARAMRAAGFVEVVSACGDATHLARLVTEKLKPPASLLYLAGAHTSADLAGDLRARSFVVHTAVVYRAVAATEFPAAALDALARGLDGVLHFSRRSAEAYVNAARGAGLVAEAIERPAHFCLATQVAVPLAQAGACDIRVAAEPDEAALIGLIPSA